MWAGQAAIERGLAVLVYSMRAPSRVPPPVLY